MINITNKKLFYGFCSIVVFAIVLLVSPYVYFYRLHNLVDEDKQTNLSNYVDFSLLKSNLAKRLAPQTTTEDDDAEEHLNTVVNNFSDEINLIKILKFNDVINKQHCHDDLKSYLWKYNSFNEIYIKFGNKKYEDSVVFIFKRYDMINWKMVDFIIPDRLLKQT